MTHTIPTIVNIFFVKNLSGFVCEYSKTEKESYRVFFMVIFSNFLYKVSRAWKNIKRNIYVMLLCSLSNV